METTSHSEKPVMTLASVTWVKAKKWQKISDVCGWWKTASFASIFLAGGILCWNPKMPTNLLGATLINAAAATIVKKVSDSVADEAATVWAIEEEEREERYREGMPDDETLKKHAIEHVKRRFFEVETLKEKDQWLFALRRVAVGYTWFSDDGSEYLPLLSHGDRLTAINSLRRLDVLTEEEFEMAIAWANSLKGGIPNDSIPWPFVGMLRDAIAGHSVDPLSRPSDLEFQRYCHQLAMVVGLRLESDVPDLSRKDILKVISWLDNEDYLYEKEVSRLTEWIADDSTRCDNCSKALSLDDWYRAYCAKFCGVCFKDCIDH